MTTILDIANNLGVSKGTVSKALSGAEDVSETLRKTILETAVEMGYTKKRRNKTAAKKLCIMVENMEYMEPNHFGYDLILGFRKKAEPAGFTVDIVPISTQTQKASSYDIYMLENDYIGSFILGLSLTSPWMKDLHSSHTPAVLYDNYIRSNPCCAYVGIDNNEGMDLAVSHLRQLGHKKIGYLSGALGSHIMQVRHKAFFSALRQNGLTADPLLAGTSYYISECMQKHILRLLKHGVTAFICGHDLLANAAIIQCQELGYHVPDDINIIGFDDIAICPYTNPPLTTIRQNLPEVGKCGYYALDSLLNHVSIGTILLHAQLMVRKSTGPVSLIEKR